MVWLLAKYPSQATAADYRPPGGGQLIPPAAIRSAHLPEVWPRALVVVRLR